MFLWCFEGKCDKIEMNKGEIYKMEVDILIDRITDCLIDTRTGKELEKKWKRNIGYEKHR